jgi:hypothetical protein
MADGNWQRKATFLPVILTCAILTSMLNFEPQAEKRRAPVESKDAAE